MKFNFFKQLFYSLIVVNCLLLTSCGNRDKDKNKVEENNNIVQQPEHEYIEAPIISNDININEMNKQEMNKQENNNDINKKENNNKQYDNLSGVPMVKMLKQGNRYIIVSNNDQKHREKMLKQGFRYVIEIDNNYIKENNDNNKQENNKSIEITNQDYMDALFLIATIGGVIKDTDVIKDVRFLNFPEPDKVDISPWKDYKTPYGNPIDIGIDHLPYLLFKRNDETNYTGMSFNTNNIGRNFSSVGERQIGVYAIEWFTGTFSDNCQKFFDKHHFVLSVQDDTYYPEELKYCSNALYTEDYIDFVTGDLAVVVEIDFNNKTGQKEFKVVRQEYIGDGHADTGNGEEFGPYDGKWGKYTPNFDLIDDPNILRDVIKTMIKYKHIANNAKIIK